MKLLYITINTIVLSSYSGALRLQPRDESLSENSIESLNADNYNGTYNQLSHLNDISDKFSFKNIIKFFKGDVSQDGGESNNEQESNVDVELVKELLDNYESDAQEGALEQDYSDNEDDDVQLEQQNFEGDGQYHSQNEEAEENDDEEEYETYEAEEQDFDEDDLALVESNESDGEENSTEESASDTSPSVAPGAPPEDPESISQSISESTPTSTYKATPGAESDTPTDDKKKDSKNDKEDKKEKNEKESENPKESGEPKKGSSRKKLKKPFAKVSNNLKKSDSLQSFLDHLGLVKEIIPRKKLKQANANDSAETSFLYNQVINPNFDRKAFYDALKTDRKLRQYIKENIHNFGISEKLLHKSQGLALSNSTSDSSENEISVKAAAVDSEHRIGNNFTESVVEQTSFKKKKDAKKDAKKIADRKDSNKKFAYNDPDNMYETVSYSDYSSRFRESLYGNSSRNSSRNGTYDGSDPIPDVHENSASSFSFPEFLGVLTALAVSTVIMY